MHIRIDLMYEAIPKIFNYPHSFPKNEYFISDEKYSVPEIIQSMIEDLDEIFHNDLIFNEESERSYPLDRQFIQEYLYWYLWTLDTSRVKWDQFSNFNLDNKIPKDKLKIYYRKNSDNTFIRIKPWVETILPKVTPYILKKFPKITQQDLYTVMAYFHDIIEYFEFDSNTKRPIFEQYHQIIAERTLIL